MLPPKYQCMAILLGTVPSVPFGKWPKMELSVEKVQIISQPTLLFLSRNLNSDI